MNICPVCNLTLSYPPINHKVCPCCGTEFGFDDLACSFSDLRDDWIESGMVWWSTARSAPPGWDPRAQLFGRALVPNQNEHELGVVVSPSRHRRERPVTLRRARKGRYDPVVRPTSGVIGGRMEAHA